MPGYKRGKLLRTYTGNPEEKKWEKVNWQQYTSSRIEIFFTMTRQISQKGKIFIAVVNLIYENSDELWTKSQKAKTNWYFWPWDEALDETSNILFQWES